MKISHPAKDILERLPLAGRTGLVVMAHNRAEYLRRCLDSLKHSDLKNTILLIFDDASSQVEARQLIDEWELPQVPIVKIRLSKHKSFNIHENLKLSFDLLLARYQCDYLAVLDSDMIAKPEWLETIHAIRRRVEEEHGGLCIASGFHCWAKHRSSARYQSYNLTHQLGGANMLFSKHAYPFVRMCLRPCWDDVLTRHHQSGGLHLAVARPSVLQHIGAYGLFSSKARPHDQALDYYSFRQKEQWPIFISYLIGWYFSMPWEYLVKKLRQWSAHLRAYDRNTT